MRENFQHLHARAQFKADLVDESSQIDAENLNRHMQPFGVFARETAAAHVASGSASSSSVFVQAAPSPPPACRARSASPLAASSRPRSASPPEPEVAGPDDAGTCLQCFSCKKFHTDIPRGTVRAFANKVFLCSYVQRRCVRKRRVQ